MKKKRLLSKILLSIFQRAGREDEADVRLAKARLPGSWFTKKGPGVEAEARRCFYALSDAQRIIAVERGWVPRAWLPRRLS